MAHAPVLLREAVDFLSQADGHVFLDATFGGGGHTRALLNKNTSNVVWAIDRDPAAAERARCVREQYGERFHFSAMNFSDLDTLPVERWDGILFDLGVSSFQLDDAARGFSFSKAGVTDMRMDTSGGVTAAVFLEKAPEAELIRAVRDYGEESAWKMVVKAIVGARGRGILEDTQQLVALIAEKIGHHYRAKKIHPATKTFQGIRIAINDELGAIERALPAAFEKLAPNGILAVIAFHSLEDRIIKRNFNKWIGKPIDRNDSTPQQNRKIRAKLLTRKPSTPNVEECSENPRARSAKLRVIQKI